MVPDLDVNVLHYGDNIDVLRAMPSASVDLVYLDPPFNSNRAYNVIFRTPTGEQSRAQLEAFDDTWAWGPEVEAAYHKMLEGGVPDRVATVLRAMANIVPDRSELFAYLVMMAPRLLELHRVLKPIGTLYLHCDPTASHYLKLMLDAIFGPENYRSEIIWERTASKGLQTSRLANNHDVIFTYQRESATWNVDAAIVPYDLADLDEKTEEKYSLRDPDGRRYQLTSLLNPSHDRPNLTYEFLGVTRVWRWEQTRMQEAYAAGLVVQNHSGSVPRFKRYLDEQKGKPLGDVWTDIPPINARAKERLGYPTQKPLALLERIISMSSNEGDVVLDPFCGCGTTIDAAQRLKRHWIGIDITYIAIDLITKRLKASHGSRLKIDIRGIPRDVEGARALFGRNPFDFERWAVSLVDGQPNEKQVGDKGIDGVVRFPDSEKEIGRALVSVKGGKQLNPNMVRDLIGTVESEHAAIGILILLEHPTAGMLAASKKAGLYEIKALGRKIAKLQILTVSDLLGGKRPDMPMPFLPYVQAKGYAGTQLPLLSK